MGETNNKTRILAVSGKGGVGKTTLSAAAVRLVSAAHPGAKVLAIDADPAIGLSTALGVEVTETLDDIRQRVAVDVTGKLKATEDILAEARFHLFDAMTEHDGFSFLAIGRPESAGCYCAINTYLRETIAGLADKFDYIIIDGEAGIEQINRRVMEKVTDLLFITDQSRKGYQVVETVKKVADDLVMYENCGVIINRALHPEMIDSDNIAGAKILSVVLPDEAHVKNDIEGNTVFDLPENSEVLQGMKKTLEALGLI